MNRYFLVRLSYYFNADDLFPAPILRLLRSSGTATQQLPENNPSASMSRSDQAQASSTSNSPSSQAQLNQALRQREAEKPRLTDDQKKTNHITSEQNRRNFLRSQFDRLSETVPGAKGKARSEALVLEKLVQYGHAQLEEGRAIIDEIESNGGVVDARLKAKYYGGTDADGYGEVDGAAGQDLDHERGKGAYDTRSRSFE